MSVKSSSPGDQKMTNPFWGKFGQERGLYLIKGYKARKLQVQERIIPAKVRIHPPQPNLEISNLWRSSIFGPYMRISFTYYFHCYNKRHEYPDQITRRRHPATERK